MNYIFDVVNIFDILKNDFDNNLFSYIHVYNFYNNDCNIYIYKYVKFIIKVYRFSIINKLHYINYYEE